MLYELLEISWYWFPIAVSIWGVGVWSVLKFFKKLKYKNQEDIENEG